MLDVAAIRLLMLLAKETQRVRPLGQVAKVVTNGTEAHYEALLVAGFVAKEDYPLVAGSVSYTITAEGERHCRYALGAETIIKTKKGSNNRDTLS